MYCVNNAKRTEELRLLFWNRCDEFPNFLEDSFIDRFIKTGLYEVEWHGKPVLYDGGDKTIVYDNGLFMCENLPFPVVNRNGDGNYTPCGCIAQSAKRIKDCHLFILNNADYDSYAVSNSDNTTHVLEGALVEKMPSISFRCVARLFNKSVIEAAHMFADGTIYIKDWTPDKLIPRVTGKLPPPGYQVRGNKKEYWHRPASILFTCGTTHYLIGQDEGSYFGVELPESANTVTQAFNVLMPKIVRKQKNVQRQGEWFIWPVEKPPVILGTISRFGNRQLKLDLPREHYDSNVHSLCADEIVVDYPIWYAKNFSIFHPEHNTLTPSYKNRWYAITCNTAVRSVSVEGVD